MQYYVGRINAASLQIIPKYNVDLDKLVEMAIYREAPFDEKGRGFRDAIILENIIYHARQYAGSAIGLVSADNIFDEPLLRNRGRSIDVDIVRISSIEDVPSVIKDRVFSYAMSELARQRTEVLKLARERSDEVYQYVDDNIRISSILLRGLLESETKEDPWELKSASIEQVDDYRLIEIVDVNVFPLLHNSVDEGREPFTLALQVEFDITISTVSPFATGYYDVPQEGVPGKPQPWSPERIRKQVTVTRNLLMSVSVRRKNGQISDLRMERLHT